MKFLSGITRRASWITIVSKKKRERERERDAFEREEERKTQTRKRGRREWQKHRGPARNRIPPHKSDFETPNNNSSSINQLTFSRECRQIPPEPRNVKLPKGEQLVPRKKRKEKGGGCLTETRERGRRVSKKEREREGGKWSRNRVGPGMIPAVSIYTGAATCWLAMYSAWW